MTSAPEVLASIQSVPCSTNQHQVHETMFEEQSLMPRSNTHSRSNCTASPVSIRSKPFRRQSDTNHVWCPNVIGHRVSPELIEGKKSCASVSWAEKVPKMRVKLRVLLSVSIRWIWVEHRGGRARSKCCGHSTARRISSVDYAQRLSLGFRDHHTDASVIMQRNSQKRSHEMRSKLSTAR